MDEIIGAIIGAVLGVILTWYFTRRRPTRVLFDWIRRYHIVLDLPDTKILYRDTPLEKLYVLGLSAHNTGFQVIENPKFVLRLQEGIRILGASAEVSPDREGVDCRVSIRGNEVEFTLNRLYPYSLNQELALINLFSDSELSELSVAQIYGNGVFQDGTGWSTHYRPTKAKYIPLLGMSFYPPEGREIIYVTLTAIGFVELVGATIACLLLNPPIGILSVDFHALQLWLNNFWSWLWLSSLVFFISWAFAMGLRGWVLPIPMPFLGRAIHIWFVRTRRPKE